MRRFCVRSLTTNFHCWGRTIRVRWLKCAAILLLPIHSAAGQDAALRLKAGFDALEQGDTDVAIRELSIARNQLPLVADYAAYWLASAHAKAKNFASVPGTLEAVWKSSPDSPLTGRAAVLGARALVETGKPREAIAFLRKAREESLPQPQAAAVLAAACELSGDLGLAVSEWRRVYYAHPASEEAAMAALALNSLEKRLGERFPRPAPAERLERAGKLRDARQYVAAQKEYLELADEHRGLESEQARVRGAALAYLRRSAEAAATALEAIRCENVEADAERLYWLTLCYRRLDREPRMQSALERLKSNAPLSPWRQKALVAAANGYLVTNEHRLFLPLYRECAEQFPDAEDAAVCHWRVAWRSYLDRKPDAPALLREHLERYPSSEKANASLFFLGRHAERSGDFASARRIWREILTRFPNSYYGLLARDLLEKRSTQGGDVSQATEKFLQSIAWPARPRAANFSADANTARRIDRARILARAGLDPFSDAELRYGARNGANPWPIALELAETSARRGKPDVGLRHIKGTVPSYLYLPREAAPEKFWRHAFPFPYRARIDRYAKRRNLDPFLVAALIRQESEFNPSALSAAKAVGLMQVMPGTGRELSRKVGMKQFTTSMLKNPDVSINLGTYYLMSQFNRFHGNVDEVLASYNAGPTRIPKWRTWGDFREPAEFIETIPLAQTREYVQIIQRNADMYRWLYGKEPVVDEPEPIASPVPDARKSAPSSATKKKPAAKSRAKKPAQKKGKP